MKEEALKLANQLDGLNSCEPVIIKACETMIRRLVEELDKQEKSDANLHLTPLPEADRSPLDSNGSISQHKAIMRKNAFNEYIPLFLGNDGLPEGTLLYTTPQTKPLSDEEIKEMATVFFVDWKREQIVSFARAIEERHGIK